MARVTVTWKTAGLEGAVKSKQADAARDIAGFLLDEANKTVPLEEATLERSGFADSDEDTAVVAYDTPYAVVQHEMMDWNHPGGRRAKWLERTFQEQARRAYDFYVSRMKGAF